MLSEAQARDVIVRAYGVVFGRACKPRVQFLLA